ncbi:20515_t:CDS:1, partial [Dentiscutata erythropus]
LRTFQGYNPFPANQQSPSDSLFYINDIPSIEAQQIVINIVLHMD